MSHLQQHRMLAHTGDGDNLATKPPDPALSRVVLAAAGFISIAFVLPMTFYFNADAYWKYKWRPLGDGDQPFDLSKI